MTMTTWLSQAEAAGLASTNSSNYEMSYIPHTIISDGPIEAVPCRENHDLIVWIHTLALGAGFDHDNAIIATGVALAESGGDPGAYNKNSNGSTDRGLWQINSVHEWADPDLLFDPSYNARAAFRVFDSQGWTAWYGHTPRGSGFGSGKKFNDWMVDVNCVLTQSG